jgi:hypothetical protein
MGTLLTWVGRANDVLEDYRVESTCDVSRTAQFSNTGSLKRFVGKAAKLGRRGSPLATLLQGNINF